MSPLPLGWRIRRVFSNLNDSLVLRSGSLVAHTPGPSVSALTGVGLTDRKSRFLLPARVPPSFVRLAQRVSPARCLLCFLAFPSRLLVKRSVTRRRRLLFRASGHRHCCEQPLPRSHRLQTDLGQKWQHEALGHPEKPPSPMGAGLSSSPLPRGATVWGCVGKEPPCRVRTPSGSAL